MDVKVSVARQLFFVEEYTHVLFTVRIAFVPFAVALIYDCVIVYIGKLLFYICAGAFDCFRSYYIGTSIDFYTRICRNNGITSIIIDWLLCCVLAILSFMYRYIEVTNFQ